jgi:hypothetical protein
MLSDPLPSPEPPVAPDAALPLREMTPVAAIVRDVRAKIRKPPVLSVTPAFTVSVS